MKKTRINKKYSPEFKISCIMDMRENKLGYCETVRKYNLGISSVSSAILTLHRWERTFLEQGEAGFYIERRGKTTKMDNPRKGRPRKILDKKVRQDLIAQNQQLKQENEYLKAELEYLKKLDALVRAEEQKKSKKH